MKKLSQKRILNVLKTKKWGTLLTVDGNKPYGVEVAFTTVGKFLYVIFNPSGRTAQCINKNKNVAFKVCTSDDDMHKWEAVIVEGAIDRVTNIKDIKRAFRALAKKLGYDKKIYDKMASKYADNPANSPVHRIPLKVMGGKASF